MAGYAVDAVVLGAVYTLFALGLTLSWGTLNILNLAHGSIFLAGAISAYLITQEVALSLPIVLVLAMSVSGALAVAIELLVFRPIRQRSPDEHSAELAILIASVAVGAVLVAVALNITDGNVVSINKETFTVKSHEILGLDVLNVEVLIVALSLVLSIGLAFFVTKSRHGRALRALAFDRFTCGLLGISSERLAMLTMFVSGAMAGIAGVLLGIYLNAIEAHMGEPLLLKAFAVIILGGVGSVWGAIAGAYLIAGAEVATVAYASASLKDAVAFALILLLLLLRPQGLFSKGAWQRP